MTRLMRSRTEAARVHNSCRVQGLPGLLLAAGVLSVVLGVTACRTPAPSAQKATPDQTRLLDNAPGDDWPAYGRTYGEQHYSPLTGIDRSTVARLGLVAHVDLPPGNTVTQPLEVGGRLFFTVGNSIVHAVDAMTGKILWVHDPKANEKAGPRLRSSWGSRGLAYWNGKVITGTVDGRLVAIDAVTGREVWSQQTLMPGDLRYITGAPRVFDGKVIIGHGGADSADIRGYVTTYDADTGRQLWRFFTVPGDPSKGFEDDTQAMIAKTWAGQWWRHGGGGNVWNAFTYDAETDTILLGTGNGAPWNRRVRSASKRDNLFLCSIVALDAKTGRYKWHYQINPGETWDYNASMDMHLADLRIDGRVRKVIVTAPKNGFLYVIDRSNGKLISARKIAKVTWAERIDIPTGRPVEVADARFPDGKSFELWPSAMGAHTNLPSAFNPRTGLVYVPVGESGIILNDVGIDPRTWRRRPGGQTDFAVNAGYDRPPATTPGTSELTAFDPATGRVVWKVPTPLFWNGGLLTTGGGLVFQGQAIGSFNAYDATNGQRLWTFDARGAVMAGAISYSVRGRQYVAVLTGMGLTAAINAGGLPRRFDYRTQPRRLLIFALGGRSTLPPVPPYRLVPVADPDFHADPAAEQRGAIGFIRCLVCHGPGVDAGGGLAPDLRASAVPLSPETFRAIVKDGGLVSQGMPQFGELSDAELADIRQYVRSRAAAARSPVH